VPAASDAPGSVDGTLGSTVISASDADACAVAYTVAVGWQRWWQAEQPIWKAGSMPTVGAVVPKVIMGAQQPTDLLAAVAKPDIESKQDTGEPKKKDSESDPDG
jgi:hypothetical protein